MRLYYGTYGHHLSGKLYVYWGEDNLRTGEQVVAPVTNKNSGKTYNTMFTIARAQNEQNAQGEVDRLSDKGIAIKTIGGRGTLSLPGGSKFNTKIEWKRESERIYRKKFNLPPIPQINTNSSASKPRTSTVNLAGGSAPRVRPTGQRKSAVSRSTVIAARNSLLSKKRVSAETTKQKERIRAIKNTKRP